MTAPTQPVEIDLADFGGPATANILVSATMSDVDMTADGTVVSTRTVNGRTDATGKVTLQCFPNAIAPVGLGTKGTTTRFYATLPGSKPLNVTAIVPNAPCNLVDIQVVEEPVPAPPDLVRTADLLPFAKTTDLAPLAKTSDVAATYETQTNADATYAKKTDLTPYATLTGAESLLNKVLENPAGKTQTLTDDATITWDTDAGQLAFLTLSTVQASRTLANPAHIKPGALYALVVDNPNGYEQIGTFGNAIVPITSLSVDPAVGARTVLLFFSNGTTLFGVNPAAGSGAAGPNNPPVNTVPGAEPVTYETPYVFSTANGNAITVADVDGTPLTTVLTVTSGTLTAVTGTGASITGNGTASVTIAGPVPQINGALDGLIFTPATGFSGGVTLTVATSDATDTDTDTIALTVSAAPGAPITAQFEAGVNLSGLEWSAPNVRYGTSTYPNINLTTPRAATIAYLAAQGVTMVRLPISWEMLQPVLFDSPANATVLAGYTSSLQASFAAGDLWEPQAQAITGVLDACQAANIKCVLDIHNYCRYKDFVYQPDGSVIGFTRPTDKLFPPYTSDGNQVVGKIFANASTSPTLTQAHFTDLWERMATRWKDHPGLGGYGLMNEPNSMPTAATNTAYNDPFVTGNVQDYTIWPSYAQAAVTAIRAIDGTTPIFVMGNEWGNPVDWPNVNPGFPLTGYNIVYEFHEYLDHKNSGHLFDWDTEVAAGYSAGEAGGATISTATGTNRLQPLLTWAAANGNPVLACGEFGIPVENLPDGSGIDQRWLDAADATLAAFKTNNIRTFTWMGGDHYAIHAFPINHVPKLHQGRTVEPIAGAYLKKQLNTNSATVFDEGGQWSAAGSAVTVKVQARGFLTAPVTLTVASDNGGTFSKTSLTLAAGVNSEDSYTFTPVANAVTTLTYTRTGGGQVPPARVVYSLTDPVAYAATDLTKAAKAILAKYSAACWLAKDALSEYLNPVAAAAGEYIRGISDSGSGSTIEAPMEAINWMNQDPGSLRGVEVPAVFNNDPSGYPAADFTIYGRRGLISRKMAPWVSTGPNDDDYQHPAVTMPFGITDDHFMVAAFAPTIDPTSGTLMAASEIYGYDAAHNRTGQHSALQLNAGKVQLEQIDVAGTTATIADATALTVNTLNTASFVSTQGAQKLRVNGTQVATGAATFAASNFSAATIGYGYWNFYPVDAAQAYEYGYVMGKGQPSDAEMGVLEDYLHAAAQTTYMLLGMNQGAISTYSGSQPFANRMRIASDWIPQAGYATGTYTNDQGLLTASVSTDRFMVYLADHGNSIEPGTWTVKTHGNNLGVGGFGQAANPSVGGHTGYSTTDFTFTLTGAESFVGLYCIGSVTGDIEVIPPGHTSADLFHNQYGAVVAASGQKLFRSMDWTAGASNKDKSWSDRTVAGKITFNNPSLGQGVFGGAVPWEYVIEAANRYSIHPWITIPFGADDDYVTKLAQMFNDGTNATGGLASTGLNAGLVVHVEYSNEVWNNASAYFASTSWNNWAHVAASTATLDTAVTQNTIEWTGHGCSVGDLVNFWTMPSSYANGIQDDADGLAPIAKGVQVRVDTVPDANHVTLTWNDGPHTPISVTANKGVLTFIAKRTQGQTAAIDNNMAQRSKQIWTIFRNTMGAGRVYAVLGAQGGNSDTTTQRLASSGVAALTEGVCIAPYYDGDQFYMALDITGGTSVRPSFFSVYNGDAYFSAFASGTSGLSNNAIKNGTGGVGGTTNLAGYVKTSGQMTPAPGQFSALVDGTTYDFYTLFTNTATDRNTIRYRLKGSVAPTAGKAATSTTSVTLGTGSKSFTIETGKTFPAGQLVHIESTTANTMLGTVTSYDSGTGALVVNVTRFKGTGTFATWNVYTRVNVFAQYADQQFQSETGINLDIKAMVDNHLAAIAASTNPAVELVCYEGGSTMDQLGHTTELSVFNNGTYQFTSEAANVLPLYYTALADRNVKKYMHFSDYQVINSPYSTFQLMKTMFDTTAPMYVAYKGFGGQVAKGTALTVANVTGTQVTADPGTYPVTVATMPDNTLTYSVIGGDDDANFGFVGNALQLQNGNNINYAALVTFNLKCRALNRPRDAFFTATVVVGPPTWHVLDTPFALNMTTQASTASLTPDVGGVLSLTGTGGTLSGGLLLNGAGNSYTSSTAMTAVQDMTKPFGIAVVCDANGQGYTAQDILRVGAGGQFISAFTDSGGVLGWDWYNGTELILSNAYGSGAHVHWFFCDGAGTVTTGIDQSNGATGAKTGSGTITRDIYIGPTSTKVGSIEPLWRTGMTLADFKSQVVQSLQTLHGI